MIAVGRTECPVRVDWSTNFEKVREFHEAFDCARYETPALPDESLEELRIDLIAEEFDELLEALVEGDLVATADAIVDLLYVTYGAGVSFGLPVDELFAEVHRSNMSKLDADGTVIRRHDGKVLKSNLYSPPNLKPILEEAGADV